MGEYLKSALQSLRHNGVLRTLQRGFQRAIPSWVFNINTLITVETSLRAIMADWEGEPPNPTLRHRWATEADMDHLTPGGFTVEEIRTFFRNGGRVAITTKDGNPVGYFWLFPRTNIFNGWIQLTVAPDEIVGGHIFVAPEFRGERWFREIRRFVFPQLIDEGYERMLGFIAALNRSSLRAGSSAERRNVGRVFYIRILGLIIHRVGGKWGAGFWRERRPLPVSSDDLREPHT